MREIRFKINSSLIETLRKLQNVRAIKFTRNLLIKTDKDKNIIIALIELDPRELGHSWSQKLTDTNKAREHFMFYIHETKIKMKEENWRFLITPIAILPIANYNVRIFLDKDKQYQMEMISSDRFHLKQEERELDPRMKFTFEVKKLTKDTKDIR